MASGYPPDCFISVLMGILVPYQHALWIEKLESVNIHTFLLHFYRDRSYLHFLSTVILTNSQTWQIRISPVFMICFSSKKVEGVRWIWRETKSMYNQLMDVMSRQDSFEEKYKQGTAERKEEIKVLKKENRSEVVYGENVKVQATMLYSEGVMSKDRIADFLNAAGNGERNLSTGSVYQFCKALAGNAKRSMEHLEEELLNQRIAAADAAVITNNGVQCYIRIFSITGAVLYRAVKEKTIDAMHRSRFPEKFTGTRIHDYETAVYHYKKTK